MANVIKRPKPKAKRQPQTIPTLPQHELPEPFAQLLTFGEEDEKEAYAAIAAEIRAGDLRKGIDTLMQMALDSSYYEYLVEDYTKVDPRSMTRLHAIRVLGQFGDAAEAVIEPLLVLLDEEDDWLREEMPHIYAQIGRKAIEPLARMLMDVEADTYARAGAGESLAEIGEAHTETRSEIISILDQALLQEKEDETLAAFIVCNLLDVGARESLPLIEQAFQEERIDPSVLEMADVQEHFGLPVTVPRAIWDYDVPRAPVLNTSAANRSKPVEAIDDFDDFDADEAEEPVQVPYVAPAKVGRNEPCPCGSGKKYKKCCGA